MALAKYSKSALQKSHLILKLTRMANDRRYRLPEWLKNVWFVAVCRIIGVGEAAERGDFADGDGRVRGHLAVA